MSLDPTHRGRGYDGPEHRKPEERDAAVAGLRQRLAEKRADALGKTVLLPVFRPEFVADQLKEAK